MGDEQELDLNPATEEGTKQARRFAWTRRHYVGLFIIATIVVFSVAIYFTGSLMSNVEAYGYLGVFLICVIASAVIIVPVPAIAVVFGMGAILNPWLVGLMVGLAEPIGELTAYMAGYSGRVAMENRRSYVRLMDWMRRRGSLVLFFFAAIPNPFYLTKLAGAAAGVLRYPLWKYLMILFFGKTAKGLLVAFAGYWTLRLVLRFLIG
ncbi:MAG: VTT domain-containing protein [Chloroflexi bacterium]|jgi:membrane protein YqaA with SNARE-associated domain|nr:VTT domain-containing protein [Chloroflexota bacterium]